MATNSTTDGDLHDAILQMAQLLQRLATPAPVNQEKVLESLSTNINEFVFDPESGITFEKWFARYSDLFDNDARSLDDAAKVRLLLRKLDNASHNRYVNYILPKLPKDITFAETVSTLKKIFGTPTSVFNKRFQCLQLVKSEAEDVISYGGKVNRACEEFEFEKVKIDDFKCLVFVCGLKAPQYADIRARLLSRMESATAAAPVTLQTLIDEFQKLVNLKADTTLIEQQASSKHTVHAVSQKKAHTQQRPPKVEGKLPRTPCWQCGQMHYVRDCPFTDHRCKTCDRVGHKEGYCSCAKPAPGSSSTQAQPTEKKPAKKKKNQSNGSSQTRGVFVVNHIANRSRKRRFVTTAINGVAIPLQLDSASDITVISKQTWQQLGEPKVSPPSIEAVNASGEPLGLTGEFQCDVTLNGTTKHGRCFVTSAPDLNVMGIDWIDMFDLWSVPFDSICNSIASTSTPAFGGEIQKLQANHPQVFDDSLGHCSKTKVKLFLKPNAKPVFCPKRPVPFNTTPLVEAELVRLQSLGIITPVDFSEWAAPIVAVRKPNGRVRICADYSTGLNDALEANHYPLPTPEEIFAQLSGSCVFSIIDLSDAYLQVEVDDDSKKLLTINTHKGLFRFNRLAPGVKSAPGAFQRLVDGMIADIPGIRSFIDDVIIFGPTWEAHAASLNMLLDRLAQYGFHVKAEKCHFFQSEIRYLGHIVDRHGIRPDPEKLKAIARIPPPTNVTELRSFLGAINFYGRFVRNIHELRHPLDQLLKKDVKWVWTDKCQQSFDKFKSILQSDLLLTHYDPKLPIIVAADASNTGIGAVILHKFPDGTLKAVQHASRSLTPAERGYGQPEKEALALIYGVTKFHKFLLGRRFTLLTDHKPLLSIFGSKKGIPMHTANRLQRWALILLNYDFEIQHVSTNDFGCADMLSRLIDRNARPEEEYVVAAINLEEDMVSMLNDSLDKLPVSFTDIQRATRKNKTLQAVANFITNGWPHDSKSIADPELLSYYNRRDSLSIVEGCVMLHDRVVIPNQYRNKLLKQFHRGHPGMVRMKSIARSFVFWPGLDKEIEDFVRNCNPCCVAGKAPTKTTLESWPAPSKPWSRIHIDYAGPVDGTYLLVVVDPFSKWPEVIPTRTTTSNATIRLLRQLFTTFGIPEKIVTDNGPQFTGHEFQSFCQSLGIQHLRTAPFHPQSNGLAERFVDTVKRSLRKIRTGGESLEEALQTFLQVYRTTPTSDLGGKSPAEVMFGRPIRTISSLLLPQPVCTPSDPSEKAEKQNKAFNQKHGAVSRSYLPGDTVYAQIHKGNTWQWEAGSIIERIGKVNYNVLLEANRRLIRSHANQLKSRAAEVKQPPAAPPLSVFVDEFGLGDIVAAARPAQSQRVLPPAPPVGPPVPPARSSSTPVRPAAPANAAESPESEYFSGFSDQAEPDSTEEDEHESPIVDTGRPRRNIKLPARFEPYLMT